MPCDVFVSHAEEDAPVAQDLARELRASGCTTWLYEEDGVPGVSYLTQVSQAIETCRVFVLIASPASVRSHQVIREVEQAHERERRIVPVRRDLTHQEYVDANPILRVASGTVVSLEATEKNLPDVARRIAGAMNLGGSATRVVPPPVSPPQPPRPWWRRWRLSITIGVSVTVAAMLAVAYVPIADRPRDPAVTDPRPAPPDVTPGDVPALRPLPCSVEGSVRSLAGNVPASVSFANRRQSEIVVYWLDYDGRRQAFRRIAPSGTSEIDTYVTHPWLITDDADRCLAVYQPTEGRSLVSVQ